MFTRTLKEIQSSTETALGRPGAVEYRSVTVPEHFTDRSSLSTLIQAAYDLGYFASEEQSVQVLKAPNAARLAYNLDNCESFGLPATCDIDDIDAFVLVLEYSKHYLAINFLHVGYYFGYSLGRKKFPENGEDANKGVRYVLFN